MKANFLFVLCLSTGLLFSTSLYSQVDTSFWFAAPEISADAFMDRPIVLRISTLSQASIVTVSMPANSSFTPVTITIAAGSTGSIDLTPWIDMIESKPPNTILNSGLKIIATSKVNIYYEVVSGGYNQSCQCNPEIFALKGRNSLGKNFLIPSQNLLSNWAYNPPSTHAFDIVASENNTTVTINPIKDIVGHSAGIPFSVVLNKGQVFSCTAASPLNTNHLGGSTVTSDKNIAVTLKDDGLFNTACWDLGGDQLVPVDNLGNEYIAVQGFLTSGITIDKVFVTAVNNNTSVYIGGTLFGVINANQTLVIPFSATAMYITASDKVYAFQISGSGCEVGLASLPSVTCRGSKEVSFTRSSSAQLTLLITTRTVNQSFFQLNGVPVNAANFSPVPGTGNLWSYARITVSAADVPALSSVRLTNSNGLFHLGVIHGDGPSGGARFGYFTDFANFSLNAFADSIRICGASAVLDAGQGYSSYNWNTGAATQTLNVTQSGFYKVNVINTEGCLLSDSSYVKLEPSITDSNAVTSCAGQAYVLPWGIVANTSGLYKDTLRYRSGCDSFHRIVNLTVQTAFNDDLRASVCSGQSYTLPWGVVVNTTGIYRDTLRYTTGCDSVRRNVNLIVQPASEQTSNPVICSGQSFTLPSGVAVSTAGIYRDTLHYVTGCDSVIRLTSLSVKQVNETSKDGYICSGRNFTLPWGSTVTVPGIYFDTLKYVSGCDSFITRFNLIEQQSFFQNLTPITCSGQPYTLPWGTIANVSGIYRDTIRYASGCDSLIRAVSLTVQNTTHSFTQKSICAGQSYTLPSGHVVSTAGVYVDTLQSRLAGCDSIITTLTLDTNLKPVVTVSKSNDIDCAIGITRLTATGGVSYSWSPVNSLDNPAIANPTASPSATTTYHVSINSGQGCTTEDSILVKVSTDNMSNGFPVPNAFTPNDDGKNDCFGVQSWGNVTNFTFSVYNRWGQRIFHTTRAGDCWDGTFNGSRQGTGVYIYQIKAKSICGDIYRKGTFVLIR